MRLSTSEPRLALPSVSAEALNLWIISLSYPIRGFGFVGARKRLSRTAQYSGFRMCHIHTYVRIHTRLYICT